MLFVIPEIITILNA